jgi:hypothetical protein
LQRLLGRFYSRYSSTHNNQQLVTSNAAATSGHVQMGVNCGNLVCPPDNTQSQQQQPHFARKL